MPRQAAKLFRLSSVQSHETDEALMKCVSDGDTAAFQRLFHKYKRPIVNYAFHYVGRQNVAEEIAQEVFLSVYRNRENYTVKAKFTTWLWTIARNASIDFLRRRGELQLDPDEEESLAPMDERTGNSLTPEAEESLIRKADRAAIEKCMSALPPSQREAISLRTYSDLSYEDIGETLVVSVSSVKSLLFRAKSALLGCLKECGYGTP